MIFPSIDTFHVASPVKLVYLLLFYAILQTPKFNENVLLEKTIKSEKKSV